jgi:hypothetical protein
MKFLASYRWRIFLVAWIVYSVHFATNVVREHYPAFTLAEHGSLFVDEYQGFHSDIFVHTNGHSVIGNQVFVSVLAAIPLFVFDPILDRLEDYSKAKIAERGVTDAEYRTEKRNRVVFFRLVKERGLDLRFGAATFITTAFFMAPLTAGFLVFFYQVLRRRGIEAREAAGLTLLLAFGTPIFFRTTGLNHNMFVMYGMFLSYVLLTVPPGGEFPVSLRNRLLGGLFAGMTLATDYIGVIILPLLYGYLFLPRLATASWKVSFRESLAMILGTVPPILFLLYTQWIMYGNPFFPGQHWMPNQNVYVNVGARGFTVPDPDLFIQNLFNPSYGLFAFGPLLLLALVPAVRYRQDTLILPRRERWFLIAASAALMLFCSMNQYSRLQFNSGVRYLMPLVPLMFLALSDHWLRMPSWARLTIGAAAVLHSWVMTVFREPAGLSWHLFVSEGPQLPWFRVWRLTTGSPSPWLTSWYIPALLLAATMALVACIWQYGARLERRAVRSP